MSPSYRTDARGVVRVFDAGRYLAAVRKTGREPDLCTCGTCGRTWDDGVVTGWTPTPAARCPFEYQHRRSA